MGLSAHCPRLVSVPRDATFGSDVFPSSPLLTLLPAVHLHSQRSTEVCTERPSSVTALVADMISLDFLIILSFLSAEVFDTTAGSPCGEIYTQLFRPDGCVYAVLKCTDFGKTERESCSSV